MTRLILLLVISSVLGCGNQPAPQEAIPPKLDVNQPKPDLEKQPGPPDYILDLADLKQQELFSYTSFAWSNGPIRWELTTRAERSDALLFRGIVRIQYWKNTVRIKEVYWDRKHLRNRWQEELRNGEWVRHGPEVYYLQDGSYEIYFRVNGKIEGEKTFYAADGSVESKQQFKAGVPIF